MKQEKRMQYTDAKILVVDDDFANVLLLKKILAQNGYTRVRTLTDSRLVMENCLEDPPDLLLLDLVMPLLDGFAILKELKKINKLFAFPVIIITGKNDHNTQLDVLKFGVQSVITKPFDYNEVLLRISNTLEIRMLQMTLVKNNLYLEEKVQQGIKEYIDMQRELTDRLLRAAEFRDTDTGDHITRIGAYTYVLAKSLGLSEEESIIIAEASKMHDIGKIGIPDKILLKPGKLTVGEWEEMKAHTVKGSEILKGSASEILKLAEIIALTHHEKWDGTGYPNGLKGKKIPLAGRITSLVDVFDALLSSRTYKKEWEMEQVIGYIKEKSGTHFDPKVVDSFIGNLYEFIALSKEFYLKKEDKLNEK